MATCSVQLREAEDRVSPTDRDSRALEASEDLLLPTPAAKWVLLEDDPNRDPAPLRVLQRLQDHIVRDDIDLQVDRVLGGLDLVEERSATVTRFDEDTCSGKRWRFAGSLDVGNRRCR